LLGYMLAADPPDLAGWAVGAAACVAVVVLAEVAMKAAVIWYVLRDAPRRGMDPLPWVIVAVFAELIGLIVYLCVRQPVKEPDRADESHDAERYS
jgi:hypothetical protein